MTDYRELSAQRLRDEFQRVSDAFPALTKDSVPLGMGGQAIVIDHQDGTVSKIFFRSNFYSADAFDNEVDVMRIINGNIFGKARTPEIVSVTKTDENPIVQATYRMTKLSGNEINWHEIFKSESLHAIERHFREAGALLAEFHSKMRNILAPRISPERSFKWGDTIELIPPFDEETNHALSICNGLFVKNARPGINHGDFHSGNFKVDENFNITGLLDFSFTGAVSNSLMDLAIMPDEGATFAISEYEALTSDIIDRDMMTMTQLSMSAAIINHWATQPEDSGPPWIYDQFYTRLNALQHITGLSFK